MLAVIATKSMASLAGLSPTKQRFKQEIAELKEESEKEQVGRGVSISVSVTPSLTSHAPCTLT